MKVYNSLTRKKEEFKPLKNKKVGMYVCGPTVYGPGHIGHARTYVAFDVIRRFLEYLGYEVVFVVNITDIHDDMISTANEIGVTIFELAEKYIKVFFEDMEALGIKKATYNPRVTENIDEIIETVKILEEKGYAYETEDGVYFDISKFEDYGKLSRIKVDMSKSGVRVKTDKYDKESSMDFALWKKAKPREPFWDSPWGKGRPGWHIECSVMSKKYLGEQFDIHGGAIDLIFPHHENEIAQSEAATGKKPFVKYWLHTGFLKVSGEKMSKSLGNYIEIRDLLEKWDSQVLRFFLASSHYRKPIDFSEKNLLDAEVRFKRIRNTLLSIQEKMEKASEFEDDFKEKVEKYKKSFIEAMEDDFNTPLAIASLFELVREVNKYMEKNPSKISLERARDVIYELTGILGLKFEEKELEYKDLIELIIEIRNELRKRKEFELSDKIRSKLSELGVELQDTPEGTKWRIK